MTILASCFWHVGGVHFKGFLLHFGSFEGNFLENFFEDGVQAARADIFGLLVHLGRESRDGGDGVFGEAELQRLGIEQRDVLLDERVLGLGEDADEIRFGERS